jgi:hypothetical protein
VHREVMVQPQRRVEHPFANRRNWTAVRFWKSKWISGRSGVQGCNEESRKRVLAND